MTLLEQLKKSIENNYSGFYLLYQPQINAKNLNLFGLETLLRFKTEDNKIISPLDFIPILEETSLIHEVGMWILDTALKQFKEWIKPIPNLRLSINFSSIQLTNKNIVSDTLKILNKYKIPTNKLTIEITESAAIDNIKNYKQIFDDFEDEGIQISIDDFGTGYSNIGYLKKMSVNEIKIDRMFVKDIQPDTYQYNLIKTVTNFARDNKFLVCIEGIENTDELKVVESLNVDVFQGYLFDKPCTVEEFYNKYINSTTKEYKERIEFIDYLKYKKETSSLITFNPKDLLSEINIGLWILRNNRKNLQGELFTDTTMKKLLGVEKDTTPKECHSFWASRIAEKDKRLIETMFQNMIKDEKLIQCEYSWEHPTRGTVTVRSSGRCIEKTENIIIFEGIHRIVDDMGSIF